MWAAVCHMFPDLKFELWKEGSFFHCKVTNRKTGQEVFQSSAFNDFGALESEVKNNLMQMFAVLNQVTPEEK